MGCLSSAKYEPCCNDCRGIDDGTCVTDAQKFSQVGPAALEALMKEGFDASVVEFYAQKLGDLVRFEDLRKRVQDRVDEEEECGICFFPYGSGHVMLLRPCCSQAICSNCDSFCHIVDKPCAF